MNDDLVFFDREAARTILSNGFVNLPGWKTSGIDAVLDALQACVTPANTFDNGRIINWQIVGNEDGGVQIVCPICDNYIEVPARGFPTFFEATQTAAIHKRTHG